MSCHVLLTTTEGLKDQDVETQLHDVCSRWIYVVKVETVCNLLCNNVKYLEHRRPKAENGQFSY